MQVLTIDWETYYTQDYSLSKMTTEEYIRDERFEAIGVSVKVNGDRGKWFSGTNEEIHAFLMGYDWDNSIAVAHHAAFDMAILNWHFGIQPRLIADTLSMSRAIDGPDAGHSLAVLAERYEVGRKGNEVITAKGKRRADFTPLELAQYGNYCCNDGDLTYAIFCRMAPLIPANEAKLIDLTMRLFTEPMLMLNKELLTSHLVEVRRKKAELLDSADADKAVLMSNPKLAELLKSMGVDPPVKISPTTSKVAFAFAKSDHEFTALLEHPDARVQAVVAARLGVKSTLEETRTERFIGVAGRGTLPVPLKYYGAHTGRWSGEDYNLQNLPRESALKDAIEAPENYQIIDCDSSQIECRTLAWLSGQTSLVEIFDKNNIEIANGVPKAEMEYDPYRTTASEIFGMPIRQVTDFQRLIGKVVVLGCGYGLGPPRLQAQLRAQGIDYDLKASTRLVYAYRGMYPAIPALWDQANQVLEALMRQQTTDFGYHDALTVNLLGIGLPNDLFIRYRDLRRQRDQSTGGWETVYTSKRGKADVTTRIYGAKVVENVTQALARIIIGEQMLHVAKHVKVVLTTHDSITSVTPIDRAQANRDYVERCMRWVPAWADGLPLNCESKIGSSYGKV